MELATEENTLLAPAPMSRIVPTTIARITASMTAYSAMSWPSSSPKSLMNRLVIVDLVTERIDRGGLFIASTVDLG